jgi:methyl-accepting chemotaxis protein
VTDEVREVLEEPRGKAGDALVRVYYTAMRRYAERRASGEAMTDRDKQVEEFLKNFSPSEYVNTSFPGAIQSLERAINFANENLPDDVKKFAENALDRAKEVRQNIEDAGEHALENFSNLEEAREEAKNQYLAARELTSAALRLAGRSDELNDLVPPVSDVMAP